MRNKVVLLLIMFIALIALIATPFRGKRTSLNDIEKSEKASFEMTTENLDIDLSNFPKLTGKNLKLSSFIKSNKKPVTVESAIKTLNEIKSLGTSTDGIVANKTGKLFADKYFLSSEGQLYKLKSKDVLGKNLFNLRPTASSELTNVEQIASEAFNTSINGSIVSIQTSKTLRKLFPEIALVVSKKSKKANKTQILGSLSIILSDSAKTFEASALASASASPSVPSSNATASSTTSAQVVYKVPQSTNTSVAPSTTSKTATTSASPAPTATGILNIPVNTATPSASGVLTIPSTTNLIPIVVETTTVPITTKIKCENKKNCFEFPNPGKDNAAACATLCGSAATLRTVNRDYSGSDGGLTCDTGCTGSGITYEGSKVLDPVTTPMSYRCGYDANSIVCSYPSASDPETYKAGYLSKLQMKQASATLTREQLNLYGNAFSLLPEVEDAITEGKNHVVLSGEHCSGTPPKPSNDVIKRTNDSCTDYEGENIPEKARAYGDLLCKAIYGKDARIDKIDRVAIIECDKTENMCECCFGQKCR